MILVKYQDQYYEVDPRTNLSRTEHLFDLIIVIKKNHYRLWGAIDATVTDLLKMQLWLIKDSKLPTFTDTVGNPKGPFCFDVVPTQDGNLITTTYRFDTRTRNF